MARAEQVDRLRGIEALLRRNDDGDEIREPVGLEEGHDASDRAHRHIEGRHRSRAALAQVGVEAALDGADQGHVAAKRDRLLRAADRLVDIHRRPVVIMSRLREHVEHRPEVGVDRLLECDDLRVRDVDVAVHVGLERPGIRHDRAGKTQEFVDAVADDRVPARGLPEDVRVRDQDLRAKPRGQVPGRDDRPVRVDDGSEGRRRYFARNLPARDHWRAWPEFANAIAYLDIETTGLSIGRDAVTVVGVFDGKRRRSFVQGDNLEDLPAAMERAKLLVTFNGSRFDVPFLRKAFPRMALDQIHLDLVHPLRRLGFVGGLKAIESQVGILRSEETTGLGGFDAVRLWHAFDAGDDDALDLLLEYNMEDVVNLEPLAELAYEGLRSLCLDGGFVTADRLPQRSMPPARVPQKNRS